MSQANYVGWLAFAHQRDKIITQPNCSLGTSDMASQSRVLRATGTKTQRWHAILSTGEAIGRHGISWYDLTKKSFSSACVDVRTKCAIKTFKYSKLEGNLVLPVLGKSFFPP